MQVTIKNQAGRLLICKLNSGRTIHLAPMETSEPIDHLEVNGNQRVDTLARAGLVAIVTIDVGGKAAATTARRQRKERA